MAERMSGPYRGYYIGAAARKVANHEASPSPGAAEGFYIGSVNVSMHGPDDPHQIETLIDLGDQRRFVSEAEALEHVERAARDYIDRLLASSGQGD